VLAGDLEGKVAVLKLRGTYCMHPFSNIVSWMQHRGAVGVIYINNDETIYTMVQPAMPYTLTIPTFNLPFTTGDALLNKAKDEYVTMRLPSIVDGMCFRFFFRV
jgi:hypothetical protein